MQGLAWNKCKNKHSYIYSVTADLRKRVPRLKVVNLVQLYLVTSGNNPYIPNPVGVQYKVNIFTQ